MQCRGYENIHPKLIPIIHISTVRIIVLFELVLRVIHFIHIIHRPTIRAPCGQVFPIESRNVPDTRVLPTREVLLYLKCLDNFKPCFW